MLIRGKQEIASSDLSSWPSMMPLLTGVWQLVPEHLLLQLGKFYLERLKSCGLFLMNA